MAKLICSNCGTIGRPKSKTRGNIIIEIILWLMMIIPGLIYSLWRCGTTEKVCRSCGSPNMVPLKSPRGKKLHLEFGGR